jgi:pyocin large subunit-like protein
MERRVYDKDTVMAAGAEKGPTPSTTIEATNTSTADPWMLSLYALKAPATKDKYIQRLIKFLDFLGCQGTKEEKAQILN